MDFKHIRPGSGEAKGAALHLTMIDSDELLYEGGKPIEIDILGLESAPGKRVIAQMAKDTNHRKKMKLDKMGVDEIIQIVDQSKEDKAELYSKLTTGWRNITYLTDDEPDDADGKVLKFTAENAKMLYFTRPWIMEKIDAFLGDRANFLGRKRPA